MYKDLLEFYIRAQRILNGRFLLLQSVRHQLNNNLPGILANFERHAGDLHNTIIKQIDELLQDNKSTFTQILLEMPFQEEAKVAYN